jgi:mono/diheme cytochrome c family protein
MDFPMTVAASMWRVVSAALRPRVGRWLLVAAWLPLAAGAVAVEHTVATGALAVLEAHCVKCHGGEKTKGGLDLTTREALLRGGETGVTVVPGEPEQSLLVQSIRHERDPHMPHKEPKLPDAAIAQIAEWIKAGAPYGRALDKSAGARPPSGFTITEADRRHWAFQPIQRPAPPTIANRQWPIANPIDQFILAKLEAAGLQPAPPADPRTLIRRLYFDLIGLPPTPEEVERFVAEFTPAPFPPFSSASGGAGEKVGKGEREQKAIAALIDRLLASPHYGERWGRHWLDLARFAETDGFEHDATRPHSWRYRDYVIKSFNDDKPYDRFIREQIAGDELWPDDPEALTATGFNLLGPDMVDSSDQVQRRHNTLNDMTDTASLVFLGLTMGCARCHDHKFEPLSQRDYYSLQAFFMPAKFDREKPIPTPDARAAYDAAMAKFNAHPQVRELAELEAPAREKIFQRKVDKLAPEAQVAHRTPPEKRDAEQANLVLETADKVTVSEKELAAAFTGEAKARRDELLAAVKKLPKPPTLPKAMALVRSDGPPPKTFVLHRGEYSQPGEEVAPGFPVVLVSSLQAASAESRLKPGHQTSSRIALADWIASPANPLTARVMVNRIWKHHFGRGLVATPSEFGTHGAKPSHPELLDWLASEFIKSGWSVKAMHRLMLTSATYQQSSVAADVRRLTSKPETRIPKPETGQSLLTSAPTNSVDPDNRLLSRMNRLRLEGEVIRDSLLAISGQLNREMGGPGVFPPIPKELFEGAKGWTPSERASDHTRRSIYIFARRNLRFPFLEVFDAPDSNLSCPSRERSTTAPQSLTLLNADEVTTAARLTAARLEREAQSTDDRVTLAYRLTLGRPPTAKELDLARAFLKQSPLNEFCRALFNLNEFVYVK